MGSSPGEPNGRGQRVRAFARVDMKVLYPYFKCQGAEEEGPQQGSGLNLQRPW